MTADDVRKQIRQADAARRRAEIALDRANAQLLDALRAAQETPGVTMGEAARLAGVSRARVYELLGQNGSRDLA